ncbi:MAG: ABC transporter permease [Spirochaetaceae bacterium]|jgi:putative ABC transport system permease protein|nr:ABC transporter permease [Spirochaetaceae bacterium]
MMKKRNLGTLALSMENLKAKPVRTACLVIVAAILAFTLFGGSILTLNLRQGLAAMTKRFGADLMVVPEGSSTKAQSLLLRGGTGYFYFDEAIADKIARTEGIARASPQFFLTSLSESCCDAMVQLIAYDPETDFVVQPWIAEKYSGSVKDGQVVVGSRITVRADNTIRLLGHNYPAAARLSRSASGLDVSIFMTMNTMRLLLGRARADGYNFLAVQEKAMQRGTVSAVLAKIDPTDSPARLSKSIGRENSGVDVVVSQSIFSGIAETLAGLSAYIHLFSVILWILALIILAAIFSLSIHERKKEFAVLRILGATRWKLAGMVLSESVITGFSGGLMGVLLAGLVVFPFSTLISERLELPYLDAPLFSILPLVLGSLLLSALVGPLASLYSAFRISRAETYFTMREGE